MKDRNKSSQQELHIAIILSDLRPGGMEQVVVFDVSGLSPTSDRQSGGRGWKAGRSRRNGHA
ncbi:MAG: hypothetical protein JRE64_12140 [Deltaproteobacteria bacterium]|nr:hypothetical protein [Deltaproteobacteria bacterium]